MDHRFISKLVISLFASISFIWGCDKGEDLIYTEEDKSVAVSSNIIVDNGVRINKPEFNLIEYKRFLYYLANSDHFIIVPLKDLASTHSETKVVLSLRYDIDYDINGAIKMAYRERKFKIRSSYFILHTANYYGKTDIMNFKRNENLIHYLKYIQDSCCHEIGFHNDLLTLQLIYQIPPRQFLHNELTFLRSNNIDILGTTSHGSYYCQIYKYVNAYFWKEFPYNGGNYNYVVKDYKTVYFEKDSLRNYDLKYQGELLKTDYFFTDVSFKNGKRWNMNMVNFDTIKPGKKVIILLHPGQWN